MITTALRVPTLRVWLVPAQQVRLLSGDDRLLRRLSLGFQLTHTEDHLV